jgi:hypothetical protein
MASRDKKQPRKARTWRRLDPHFGCNCFGTPLQRNYPAKSWAVQRLPREGGANNCIMRSPFSASTLLDKNRFYIIAAVTTYSFVLPDI